MKDKNIRNLFATQITEAVQEGTFKKPQGKTNPDESVLMERFQG